MKYLKAIEKWSDRWEFLESAPPKNFILYARKEKKLYCKKQTNNVDVIDGWEYHYITTEAKVDIDKQLLTITFSEPLTDDCNIRYEWAFTNRNGYGGWGIETISYVPAGTKEYVINFPTNEDSPASDYISSKFIGGTQVYFDSNPEKRTVCILS